MRPTSAKTFYASVQRELIAPLGLKEPNGNLTTPDDTETIDFADASSVVLSLVEDHGKAYYQDDRLANQLVQKVRQRLEESQSWQNGEIELPECKRAIDRAKVSINETLSIHPKLRIGETERQTL